MKLEDTYVWLSAACANGKLENLWNVFDEEVATPNWCCRSSLGLIRNTPGRVRLSDGSKGGPVRTRANRVLFVPLPLDSDDSQGDKDNDYIAESESSEDFSNGEGEEGSSQWSARCVSGVSHITWRPQRELRVRQDIEK